MEKEELFEESKREQRKVNQICWLINGYLAWDEPEVIYDLESYGFFQIEVNGRTSIRNIEEDDFPEVSFEEIKESILITLNRYETQEERRFLLKNDAFFSPKVLNGLGEIFPYEDRGDYVLFKLHDNIVRVDKDGSSSIM